MERIEREAAIESLRGLESYYQLRYEHYLAMATEAKEHRERVGLLLLDLGRDVLTAEDNLIESNLIDGRHNNGSASPLSLDNDSVNTSIGYAETSSASLSVNLELPQVDPQFEPEESETTVVGEESLAPLGVEQMKKWMLDLAKAMSVIESVSNSDSGKALHQNYLHHLLNHEFDIELSVELVELYLEEATRRGYLEPDEFNNDCYIASVRDDAMNNTDMTQNPDEQSENRLSKSPSRKPYELPPSDKLKPTLLSTIEGYIEENRPKRFLKQSLQRGEPAQRAASLFH